MKRKRIAAALTAAFFVLPAFSACRRVAPREAATSAAETTTSPAVQTEIAALPEETGTAPVPEQTVPSAEDQTTALLLPSDAASAASDASDAPAAVPPAEPASAAPPEEPDETEASAAAESDVTLPLRLPEANGEMEATADPDNPFIRAVCDSRGLDTSKLWAVYSVPPSGQNYVFEFYSADRRASVDLRRVYLLTDDAVIRSVAASSNDERENISVTENWFCMNVLIKGVIFPKVAERLGDG